MKELFCPLNNLKIPYQINKRTTVKAKKGKSHDFHNSSNLKSKSL